MDPYEIKYPVDVLFAIVDLREIRAIIRYRQRKYFFWWDYIIKVSVNGYYDRFFSHVDEDSCDKTYKYLTDNVEKAKQKFWEQQS